jgi:curved DNA-binding protein CbpA
MVKKSPYQILGLNEKDFEYKEIKRAYREAVRNNPPEKDPEKFAQISDAYDTLTNENYFMNAINNNKFILDIEIENSKSAKIDNSRYLKNIFEVPFL